MVQRPPRNQKPTLWISRNLVGYGAITRCRASAFHEQETFVGPPRLNCQCESAVMAASEV